MTARAVHWHEGMFLRPHHFQLAQRFWSAQKTRSDKWDVQYNWGVHSIDLDLEALSNYRCVVRSVEARLRDGTLLAFPEDGQLSPVDLKPAFERASTITVFLAVPEWQSGRANVHTSMSALPARYVVSTQELEDENTGVNGQPIQVRSLNARLILSTEDASGYEVIPIARLVRSGEADSAPDLDRGFFPPLLACDSWRPLHVGILQALLDRVIKKIDLLAQIVTSRGITFDSHGQGDAQLLAQFQQMNEMHAMLSILATVPGLHPLRVYQELCRMVGKLAIFGEGRRTPKMPLYNHDDLAGCFYAVKQSLDTLLNVLVEPEYRERAFVGAGLRMEVSLDTRWIEGKWSMFIGVQSSLSPDETIRVLTGSGQLDMKIGSTDRVDNIFRRGEAGLRFSLANSPPRILPQLPGMVYFEIVQDNVNPEWQHVQRTLSLSIRLNEKLIVGNIQNERVLAVKVGTETATMQFTLYAVPPEKGGRR